MQIRMNMKKPLVVYPEAAKQAFQHEYKRVKELVINNEFQRIVKQLRVDYGIPETGITTFAGYDQWMDMYAKKYRRTFTSAIKQICVRSKLSFFSWEQVIREYIVSGTLAKIEHFDPERGYLYAWGTCYVDDLYDSNKLSLLIIEENETHPIAIRISPYATQRDIIDYVKKSFSEIAELQERYKADKPFKIYRKKKSIVQRRNEYIYTHRELSSREIADKLSIEMDIQLSEAEVVKILSLENKRRNGPL